MQNKTPKRKRKTHEIEEHNNDNKENTKNIFKKAKKNNIDNEDEYKEKQDNTLLLLSSSNNINNILPVEILHEIFLFLKDHKQIMQLNLVCHHWSNIIQNDSVMFY